MSRFSLPPDPVFQSLNASIGFDWRLAPYDVEQSRAHATMLAATGIITDADRDALLSGLDRVSEELDAGEFPFLESDEDIHMAIERRLTEIVGAVGGKLHTARSRNDQVATDMAMFTRAHALRAIEALQDLQTAIVRLAEAHLDWAMPGYTHLQRAQPVYLSHHLLAYFWMFRRDARRFEAVLGSTTELPLGAGALAGVNFATDRGFVASELGFAGVAPNSIDAVSNRDFVLDFLVRGGDLRDAPVAAGRRDRAVVLGGVRVLRGVATPGRRAPRSCRRRRTRTRPSCCARRRRAWWRTWRRCTA